MRCLLALVLCVTARCVVGQQQISPCANFTNNAVPNAPPLPSLPTSAFKTTVRAIILNKNITVEATEYADESRKAGALYLMQNMHPEIVISRYDTNEVFDIMDSPNPNISGDKLCIAVNASISMYADFFGESPSAGSQMPHFYSTSQILGFASQNAQVYKGVRTIDGVPTNHWSSCMYWDRTNSNFTLDYYFTVPNYASPSGTAPVPVMAEIQGVTYPPIGAPYKFHHIYQYINFEPYVDDPEDVFNTPPGVFCPGRKNIVSLPNLTNSFYYREEVSDPINLALTEATIWYDYGLQMIREDSKIPPTTSTRLSSRGPFTMIHDYNTGVQYAIDRTTGACSIDPLPTGSSGFDASQNITRDTMSMRNPLQFFNLQGNVTYAGVRPVRGLQADVFQRYTDQIPGRGKVVYEVYFLKNAAEDTDVGQDGLSNNPVPAMIMEWEDTQLVNLYSIHDFDQDSPRFSDFDISPCFTEGNSIDFEMAFQVKTTVPLATIADLTLGFIRLAIAAPLVMSPIRLQNMRMHWEEGENMVYLQATLVDRAPSIAKYERHLRQTMQGSSLNSMTGVRNVTICADQCQLQNCSRFAYCARSQTCTLALVSTTSQTVSLLNNSNCDYYLPVLSTKFNGDPTLSQAWNALRNMVYGKGLSVDVPINPSSTDDSPSDVPQTLTLAARWITDEVMTSGRRYSQSDIMQQFQSLPQTTLQSFDDTVRGTSIDDCAAVCNSEVTYNCQSFAFCWDAGTCFTSHQHPEDSVTMTRSSSGCDLYFKNYTAIYQRFDGLSVVSASDTVYQNVFTENGCAKLCTYYTSFSCKSFDYCPNIGTCFLGRMHFYDVPKANIQQAPSCTHFSRNYLNDFVATAHKTIKLRDNRIVTGVTPEQCAKLCAEEPTFTCLSFDYCRNLTECRLSDASVSNTGQVTLEASATCDVYNRQSASVPASSQAPAKPSASQQVSSGSDNGGQYTSGAMAGLGFAMIICGALVGVGLIFLFFRLKNRTDDGMNAHLKNEQE